MLAVALTPGIRVAAEVEHMVNGWPPFMLMVQSSNEKAIMQNTIAQVDRDRIAAVARVEDRPVRL